MWKSCMKKTWKHTHTHIYIIIYNIILYDVNTCVMYRVMWFTCLATGLASRGGQDGGHALHQKTPPKINGSDDGTPGTSNLHLQSSPIIPNYPATNHGVNRLKRMDDLKEDKEDLNRSEIMKSSASRGTPRREVPVSTIAWHLPASPIPSWQYT